MRVTCHCFFFHKVDKLTIIRFLAEEQKQKPDRIYI